MNNISNWLVHNLLKIPYPLYVRMDTGKGMPVLLLHGLASSGETWRHVVHDLEGAPVRVLVLDLLGFGNSPKPIDPWIDYSAVNQARSVIRTLRKLHVKGPVMIVGHSMGCFVAVEVATLRPRLVRSLLLYEPPFYVGLPSRNYYRLRLGAYFALFRRILKRSSDDPEAYRRIQRLVARRYGFELKDENWIPFERSLRNAIMKQTALDNLKRLITPTQIVYGRLDQWVINDKKNLFFQDNTAHVNKAQVTAQHRVSARAARVVADLVRAAAEVAT
jgi:pimeloyl-ACP methyl ester carboxylesterase